MEGSEMASRALAKASAMVSTWVINMPRAGHTNSGTAWAKWRDLLSYACLCFAQAWHPNCGSVLGAMA